MCPRIGRRQVQRTLSSINFEANDKAIYISEAGPAVISGCLIYGTAGSPSGGSLYGIDVNDTYGVVIVGCSGAGHATAGVNVDFAANL